MQDGGLEEHFKGMIQQNEDALGSRLIRRAIEQLDT
jgi:hypothetical protein